MKDNFAGRLILFRNFFFFFFPHHEYNITLTSGLQSFY